METAAIFGSTLLLEERQSIPFPTVDFPVEPSGAALTLPNSMRKTPSQTADVPKNGLRPWDVNIW